MLNVNLDELTFSMDETCSLIAVEETVLLQIGFKPPDVRYIMIYRRESNLIRYG